jgi:predicted choloylglycine hydrolase
MVQNKLTPGQLKLINTLVSQQAINKEDKMVMVSGFTAGRETSSKELYFDEATAMIRHLHDLARDIDPKKAKMVGKIFSIAHEMRWTKTNKVGQTVADGKRVDEWMKRFSYLKKPLNSYTLQELPNLVSQFEQVQKSFLSSI